MHFLCLPTPLKIRIQNLIVLYPNLCCIEPCYDRGAVYFYKYLTGITGWQNLCPGTEVQLTWYIDPACQSQPLHGCAYAMWKEWLSASSSVKTKFLIWVSGAPRTLGQSSRRSKGIGVLSSRLYGWSATLVEPLMWPGPRSRGPNVSLEYTWF